MQAPGDGAVQTAPAGFRQVQVQFPWLTALGSWEGRHTHTCTGIVLYDRKVYSIGLANWT